MRVLVSTDIEGVAGVFHSEQVRPGNPEYERARGWMTAEANAAALGAFDGGATNLFVNDSHGGFRNILVHQMDSRVQIVQGATDQLVSAGILIEQTGYERNRIFVAKEALSIVNRPFGADPILPDA